MIDFALFIQVAVWLAASIVLWRFYKISIFHPINFYLLFHGLVFVIRPLFVHYANFVAAWNLMGFYPSDEQFVRSLEISSFGLIVFITTCLIGASKSQTLSLRGPVIRFDKHEVLAFYVTVFLLFPLITYSTMQLSKGYDFIQVDGTFIMGSTSGYVYDSQNMVIPLLALWLMIRRFDLLALVPVLAYFAFRAYVGYGRWGIILSGLCYLLVFCWSQRRIRIPRLILLGVPVIFLVFTSIGTNRDMLKEVFFGKEAEVSVLDQTKTWQEKFDGNDFANFDFLTYIAAMVPKETGTYNYGIEHLQIFTEPIPRRLWPGKPIGAPALFNLNDYGNFVGMTYSLPGSGWLDGGWLGIICLVSLAGYGLGKFYKWFTWNQRSNAKGLTYITAISMIVILYRDGSISILKIWLFTLSPIFLWCLLAGQIQRRQVVLKI